MKVHQAFCHTAFIFNLLLFRIGFTRPITHSSTKNNKQLSIHFTNITSSSSTMGYSSEGYGHGISFADVNRDNKIDLLVSNAEQEEIYPDLLYINNGNNTFVEQAAARGTRDEGLTHSIVSADIDNDGDLDAFFSNMSVFDDKHLGYGRNALYRNNGNGYYSNITVWANISNELNDSRGAIILDINNDGWQDIFAVNWGQQNEMYLNNGDGSMNRVHRGADGPPGDTSAKQGVTAADFDSDGDIDIYVCRREADNWLFVNDGNGNFTEMADDFDLDVGGRSHGATFADIDNDADLDLFVVNYALAGSSQLPPLYVFENNGDGTFVEITEDVDLFVSGYSAAFADVDNDTDLDMLLLFNDQKDPSAVPRLYLNDGEGHFNLAEYCGVEVPAVDARAVAFADIDRDGDLDIYITCKQSQNYLLRNDLNNSYNYIDILCFGPEGDFGGFGCKVYVYEPGHVGNNDYLLGYQESVSNFGYLCQNQTALHFGLGNFSSCDIRIKRTDGHIFNYANIAANQTFEMVEPAFTTMTIPLTSGWNIFSLAVEPGASYDMLDILTPISNDLIKVVDENGNSIEKIVGTWENTLGEWQATEGYYINVKNNVSLQVEGIEIETPLSIPLLEGWNIICFPCMNDVQDALNVLSDLIQNRILIKVIDEAGKTVEKIFGTWNNSIGNFVPGKGYYIKVNSNAFLEIECEQTGG